ncbi:TSUP family transporter [Simiduia curdlanivorans]|uniref:Probable membrane transporter protein n=1 Tax=Simiduia curdlanivorans TaxID=1492769 RepID=A0ABV8V5R9_9GAMM|nr:TSUP family transporter [Simiduia curdlanivorans]MDN3638568.1 TSUP family transporter [Simiduia curdlanivorans]
MDWPLWIYLLLSCTAFVAGFVSSIAGAGGMIVLPVLLWAGVPPLNALAVNKFQSVFGTLSSTINFFSKGHLDFKSNKLGLLCAFVAALLGTWLIQRISNNVLMSLLPWMLLLLAVYFAFSPDISDEPKPARLSNEVFNLTVGSGLGLYGGFFGPGMGSFYAAAFVRLRGLPMRMATAQTKPFVLVVNTTSMLVFIVAGYQWWDLAVLMAVMQFIGARIGSNMVIQRGVKLIKPLLIIVTFLLAIKLLWAA